MYILYTYGPNVFDHKVIEGY